MLIESMDKNIIKQYYNSGIEKDRLEQKIFPLEGIRTKEIIGRYLSKEKMNIIDIGGGAGYYSFWLQEQGHQVTLVDLSPKNIELTNQYSADNGIQLTKTEIGDATDLKFEDEAFDLALLFGPIYHLTNKEDRLKALSEAKRVLKPDGVVLVAVISRYASLFDGFKRDLIYDDQFEKILINDLETGIHLNETDKFEYFTTAYFHTPAELKEEITQSGLKFEKLIAIESFGWFVNDLSTKSEDPKYMEKMNRIIRMVESNDDIVAMSPHIMGVGRKIK